MLYKWDCNYTPRSGTMISNIWFPIPVKAGTGVQNPHCYMHARLMRVYSMAHCVFLFNIRSIELHLHLNTQQGSGTVFFRVSA